MKVGFYIFFVALQVCLIAFFSFTQIYVFLEGVDQQKIEAEFKPMSIDIKFHDLHGKNYRCAIPKLNKAIEPEKCKLVVKPTRVIIILFKASKGNWLDLHFKEDKVIILWKMIEFIFVHKAIVM